MATHPPLRVLIGSTFSELKDYRKKTIASLNKIEYIQLDVIDDLDATTLSTIENAKLKIAQADIFLLIIGTRYGFVPAGYEMSILEIEYREAAKQNRRILAFSLSDEAKVPVSAIESNMHLGQRLRSFKREIFSEFLVATFTTPDELANYVIVAISNIDPSALVQAEKGTRNTVEKEKIVERELSECRQNVTALQRRLVNIVPATPIWRERDFEIDRLLCFILLPFKDNFFEIYESAISPAIEQVGMRAMHAGEIFDNTEIVEDIWRSICKASIIIADVTGRNPNVFYELGICHTLGKECIVITQDQHDVPFDIRHRRFIEYSMRKTALLKSNLQKTIQTILSRV